LWDIQTDTKTSNGYKVLEQR